MLILPAKPEKKAVILDLLQNLQFNLPIGKESMALPYNSGDAELNQAIMGFAQIRINSTKIVKEPKMTIFHPLNRTFISIKT